jgi:hypothetical protein
LKVKEIILAIFILATINSAAYCNRELNRTEILQIFQTLTNQPVDTWIPWGTIESTHEKYDSASGYVTVSTETVTFDEDKFLWVIDTNSNTKETEAKGSFNKHFNLRDNKKRLFAWDGQRYTMYFNSGNKAIISEGQQMTPKVNGPLTAGIIPWGYGVYTYQNLVNAGSSATTVDVNSQQYLSLTVNMTDVPEMVFLLDPAKNYAVLSFSLNYDASSSALKTYDKFYQDETISRWIPTNITIERYNNTELLTHDKWHLTSINTAIPPNGSFKIIYKDSDLLEYYSSLAEEPMSCHYSSLVDVDSLLYERRINAASENLSNQNCATVAIKYISRVLGKNVTDLQLNELVTEPNNGTSLYKLMQFCQNMGFYSLAVKTDISSLKNLGQCQAILHLPKREHYVALDHIDDKYVWTIDLDNDKFYSKNKFSLFDSEWSDGIALLISNSPLNGLNGNFTVLNTEQIHGIIGGFPNYSCTDLLQSYDVIFCSEMLGGLCGTWYTQFYYRYGCQEDPNGGECFGDKYVGNVSSLCIEDAYLPGECDLSYDFIYEYIRACK